MTERLSRPDTARFPALQPDHLRRLGPGHQLGRIYRAGGDHPTTWSAMRTYGPTRARFDHQPPPPGDHPPRRVLYAAPNSAGLGTAPHSVLTTCLAEVFGDSYAVPLTEGCPYFALFDLVREVRLLDLVDGPWITEAGGNAAISSGLRSRSREWARAIHRSYRDVDGLFYGCSHIPMARSVVLWERAADAVPSRPSLNRPLADAALRADLERDAAFLRLPLIP